MVGGNKVLFEEKLVNNAIGGSSYVGKEMGVTP